MAGCCLPFCFPGGSAAAAAGAASVLAAAMLLTAAAPGSAAGRYLPTPVRTCVQKLAAQSHKLRAITVQSQPPDTRHATPDQAP